jgi:hypothetical protein
LKKISPLMKEKGFYLAGGSGLALQIGHRISEDLDFFTRRAWGKKPAPERLFLA